MARETQALQNSIRANSSSPQLCGFVRTRRASTLWELISITVIAKGDSVALSRPFANASAEPSPRLGGCHLC